MATTIRAGEGSTDFVLADVGAPVELVRCVDGLLTAPQPSYADGETTWRLVNHLAGNYASLVGREPEKNALVLRELLALYNPAPRPRDDAQVQSVLLLSARPITRRVPTPGPISFARGIELTVTVEESAFEMAGAFLFGSVLEQFFRRYVSINSFTKTILMTPQRGMVMQWPARLGDRHLL